MRAIRIAYSVGGKQKSLIIEDRSRIATLVSKMSVLATTNVLLRASHQGGTIQFFMSDGAVVGLGFISPAVLYGGDWAKIELRSTDFYDRLSDLVSQAEVKRIRLPTVQEQSQ